MPDILRDRLQNILREIIQAVSRLDRMYTFMDLTFDNPWTVVHSLATSDTRGRLKGDDVELLKKLKETYNDNAEAARKKREAAQASVANVAPRGRNYQNGGGNNGNQNNRRGAGSSGSFQGTCFNCQTVGHTRAQCRKPRKET